MIPNLSEQFLAPAGWRTHVFKNSETGHTIHYGSVFPQRAEPPTAVIVCLPGLSEFSEKYYEFARDMLARGFAFWVIDWQYQGRSGRLEAHSQRRHSDGFDTDISDLYKLVADYIKPSSVHPDRGRIPLIMVGHSMGANLGLRFLAQYPKYFDGAAFTAPFFGIYGFSGLQKFLSKLLFPLSSLIGKSYAPSGVDWNEAMRKNDGTDKFSSDPLRDAVHSAWSRTDPTLQVGNVTFGWAIAALKSCAFILRAKIPQSIQIPVLIAMAEKEEIVDNTATKTVAALLPKGEFIEIKGAKHEILMERDEYRNQFLKAFDKMVEVNKIASQDNLKPF